ncbi:DNA polymerase alpha catalytic subunit [Gracilaria domingensis]|nr:DNA polymerase alpha catalytic subunit [Gracilaria domingensis]
MKLSVRLSESGSGLPLMDLIISHGRDVQVPSGENCDYSTVIEQAIAVVSPGGVLLRNLLESGEVSTLGLVASECASVYRMSSVYANGLSWLFQYRLKSLESASEIDDDAMSDGKGEDAELNDDMLDKAYGCMVQAKKWCDELYESQNPFSDDVKVDAQYLIDLATSAVLQSAHLNGSRVGAFNQEGFSSREGALMEKCVRLFESFGAPKHAASCALEGMPEAPNREKHESMRAAAFSRFIDAGELEAALTAILSDPFMGGETISVKVLESESLRDAVSLLVNATADDGKLQWLVEQELPGPLKVMCGHALERRARATETFPITEMTMRAAIDPSMLLDQDMDHMDDFDVASDYELVYSWHVFHGDDASAATTALEWAGRVSNEGLLSVRNAISGPSRAYHPDEVKASEGKLIIDVKYYLESQIFPPILRLCDQIDGIEASRVAVSLGLDGRRFEKRDDRLDGYND